jgi:hypothetical protein
MTATVLNQFVLAVAGVEVAGTDLLCRQPLRGL